MYYDILAGYEPNYGVYGTLLLIPQYVELTEDHGNKPTEFRLHHGITAAISHESG